MTCTVGVGHVFCFNLEMPPKREKLHADGDIKNRITRLYQVGKTYSEIHKLLKKEKIPISLPTIKRIFLQFQKTGSTAMKKGSGRPRATTSKDDRSLKFLVLQERKKGLQKLLEEFRMLKTRLFRRTITRILTDTGFASRRCA